MQASENNKAPGLIRGLGVWAATAIVIGAMIGQSVFLVASDMSREVGSMTKVLAVWLVGGVVVLFGAFCFAELGAAMPEAGGDYIYLSRGIGPTWGFLFGWTSAMIMRPGSSAIIAAGLLRFVGFLLPSVTAPIFVWKVGIPFQPQPYQFTFTAAQPLAAVMVIVVNWVYFHVLTFSQVAQSQHVASDAIARLLGDIGAKWFTVAMIVSAFGSLHAGFLTGPRVPYAMARDGNFFGFAKRIQPKFHTPSGAVIFQGCVSILLVLTGTHQELYSYTMFATWAFLGLTAVALIRLRTTSPDLPRPYHVWGYPWTPLIFGGAAFVISVNLWLVRPVRSSIGLAIILLGVPFFSHWSKRSERPSLESPPIVGK